MRRFFINLFRQKIQFVDQQRRLRKGYLVQYIIQETNDGEVLDNPLLLAIVEPGKTLEGEPAIMHFSVPSTDVTII